ncbi:response regulator transcription factor [Paractinoplanes brasiliensis]|uniref:LuxR family two component transcriptional regulator n=1 Tax=Paractinoplanes brasiliensis TaxID=52695 RepID=A0A4R6J8L5_9ACTN|nr:response regulator transcription factor [Actinoplanes brasiliensis]TDO31802.1 LuxR family two component transcriptional regulator [Actinoplanes brasiliensis]GID30600.1 DNA-binding response regulator [Actinoplanes brasiliensis]
MEIIRTLIVDDHAAFREGLRALLETSDDIVVADEAASGEQALALAPAVQPDVVLLDLAMPGMGGIAATERLVRDMPHVRVLVLSMADDDDSVFAAMRAGARGYVLKGARKAELLRAVRSVAAGEAIFGAALAVRLMGYFAGPRARDQAFPELSDRERQILGLVAQHLTNPQIAERLGLNQKTVRNHVSSVFTKLRVADRAEAIMRAREAGL